MYGPVSTKDIYIYSGYIAMVLKNSKIEAVRAILLT